MQSLCTTYSGEGSFIFYSYKSRLSSQVVPRNAMINLTTWSDDSIPPFISSFLAINALTTLKLWHKLLSSLCESLLISKIPWIWIRHKVVMRLAYIFLDDCSELALPHSFNWFIQNTDSRQVTVIESFTESLKALIHIGTTQFGFAGAKSNSNC